MKFVVLGKYSTQGLAGFVKNPSDNRQEAAKKITEAAGGKLIEMMTLRGAYDFIAIIEGSDFETMAGMKMLMQSTGTIEDMNIMEAVDFNKAAEKAAKAASSYRPVGNSFTVLNRGKSLGTFNKKDISREELLGMMAGGEELDKLEVELKEMDRLSKN